MFSYLPFEQFFAEQMMKPALIKQQRLRKNNRFGLPGGEYQLQDLYATHPLSIQEMYFLVIDAQSGEQLATLFFDLGLEIPEITLSSRHLQSEWAEEALEWAHAVINTEATADLVSERVEKIMSLFTALLEAEAPSKPNKRRKKDTGETGVLIPFRSKKTPKSPSD